MLGIGHGLHKVWLGLESSGVWRQSSDGSRLFAFYVDACSGSGSFYSSVRECLPHLGLIVSRGNTLLSIDIDEQLSVIAQTVDDAAGEALDKGAKLLGLPYQVDPWSKSWQRRIGMSFFRRQSLREIRIDSVFRSQDQPALPN